MGISKLTGTELRAVVLAAGKGTRLQELDNDAPKVMREVCGRPLLWYVLEALSFIPEKDIIIVVGYRKDDITDRFQGYTYAEQREQLGTGHAVLAAKTALLDFCGSVLVCYGDMPAIKQDTYKALFRTHINQGNDCTLLTGESNLPLPYGRILRDQNGSFLHVVEERDCTPEQFMITELNPGVYLFRAEMLFGALKELKNDNSQGEYYVTDVPAIMRAGGAKIGICKRDLGNEIVGVNNLEQLIQVGEILEQRFRTP